MGKPVLSIITVDDPSANAILRDVAFASLFQAQQGKAKGEVKSAPHKKKYAS